MKKRILAITLVVMLLMAVFAPAVLAAIAFPDTAYQIRQVERYRHAGELNAQLYLITFNLVYTAGTPDDPIDDTFIFRLNNGVDIIKTTTAYGYNADGYDGYGIAAIWFSADDAPTWGGAFTTYFDGNPTLAWAGGSPPSINTAAYSLTYDEDTVKNTQDRLAIRLRYLAQELETNWGGTTDLIEDTAVGKVLTTEGEDYFENTITNLRAICPDIFYQSMQAASFDDDILVLDFHAGGNDDISETFGVNWFAQTFTTSEKYDITGVQIPGYRVGNPGDLTVSIRAMAAGVPTGADLANGTYDADTLTTNTAGEWIDVAFTSDYTLNSATEYAIVVRATAGNAANYFAWLEDTDNGYAGGTQCTSVNSGVAWAAVAANDNLFEVLVRGGAGLSYGHRYELQLLGMQFDISQIATNWGTSNMWIITSVWLVMTIVIVIVLAMTAGAFDLWLPVSMLMAAFGWRSGFADTYLLVGLLVLCTAGVLYGLFYKKAF